MVKKNLPVITINHSPVLASAVLGFLMAGSPVVAQTVSDTDAQAQSSSVHISQVSVAPAIADASLAEPVNSTANLLAADTGNHLDGMDQVTSVSQLTDVQPTDWAFQALQSLVERYGCIVGYPDRTFRGNRALSRYEFAAGLNACMDRINELIAAGTADLARKEDLVALQKLQEEFAAELAVLRGRVDALEVRTATLEKQQFSTTTKLFGQVILGVQGRDEAKVDLAGFRFSDDSDQINVITNVQLSLYTQFSERSLLLTGLQAGLGRSFGDQLLTNDVLLGYEGDTGGRVQISDLTYRHLIGNNFAVVAGAAGVNMVNVFRGANRVESAGFGPISRFAQRNPILNIGGDGAGAGFDWQITPAISLQGVYTSNRASDPANGGLFGGQNGATTVGAQLTINAFNTVDIALNYVNAYSPSGFLGTSVGDDQLALPNPFSLRAPIKTNAFGGTVAWRVASWLTVGGWVGYTTSDLKGFGGSVETLNWMGFLNFPDLGGAGNLGAIYVGQPPRIISSDLPAGRNVPSFVTGGDLSAGPGDQPGRTTHVEAFYRLRLTDNISLTPGFIVIFNPRHNDNNDTIKIGVLRTTFTF
ncbi:carbohydrate porin [Leptothermofonsia sichuanensis E412]|uniref:iron uptake porin n=1 Tax=Leptothermofonsia sichuanensis TaxID=2917832 RepID=UPI001CA629F4|nr:iron uptake porin [Leptothermofonsia sichuanensis]QZZ21912.1 carbohydrate porin [Leptothermofonsia sichuanensis E412]